MTFSKRTLSRLTYDPATVEGRLWGYARVSTEDQNLAMQIDALTKAGVAPERIYREHMSGANRARPELAKVLRACREGDTLVVWRTDRLGRDLLHILETVYGLGQRGVLYKSLMESIDTSTATGKLMLHVFGMMAEFERNLTKERTKRGVAVHRERGGKHGAPLKLDLAKVEALLRQGVPVKEVARRLGIKHASNIYHHYRADDIARLARLGPKNSTARKRKT